MVVEHMDRKGPLPDSMDEMEWEEMRGIHRLQWQEYEIMETGTEGSYNWIEKTERTDTQETNKRRMTDEDQEEIDWMLKV